MKLLLTIKKEKKKLIWGHVFFIENLLIAYGATVDEVENKLMESILSFYEITPEAIQFIIQSQHQIKAQHVVKRLLRKPVEKELTISFNSEYFI